IGAGTVLDIEMARQAVAAGAEFLISPNLDEEVIRYGLDHGLDVWPGVMTPTEIVRAWKAGASAVKVFPSGTLGANYIKDIRGPLNHIPLIATGGVNLQNIADYFKAGAVAVGLGGNLVNKTLINSGNFAEIARLASQYVAAARQAGEAG
ncbi:MAG TPA: bifunctional 4-hydroxy-2-oxoglutarate aldolase/2-dehydro-3-deoxy-phosphogluconate aldolase, partial [Bacilli bacterium]